MNVNNNNVIQMLRSNVSAPSREAAIALLDGFHNHQYGQFIVVKYKPATTITLDEEPNEIDPVMVAVGVNYPDDYAIVYDGNLKTSVISVDATDRAKGAGMNVDPITGNVLIDLLWNWKFDRATGKHTIEDNLYLKNIHRLPETPVDSSVEPHTGPTDFRLEVEDNEWHKMVADVDNYLILGYKDGGEELGWVSMSDFIVDSIPDDANAKGKKWWVDEIWKTKVAHPKIVAPSLESVAELKDELEERDNELSKRINDVHDALHSLAVSRKKNPDYKVHLNDGGVVPDWMDSSEAKEIKNKMCLFIDTNTGDKFYIGTGDNDPNLDGDDNLEGVLYRIPADENTDWVCPIEDGEGLDKPEALELKREAEWDDRFEGTE